MNAERLPSKGEIDRIGRRIRDNGGRVPDDDLPDLRVWRGYHESVIQEVVAALASLGHEATPRVKTLNTMVEKLMREPHMRLSQVQDIAGCRIVIAGGMLEQDLLARRVQAKFADSRLVDRRTSPSYGYRALHVIVRHRRCFTEVQLRTELQHVWAEAYERLADLLGRGMRYGNDPDEPSAARMAQGMRGISETIRYLEEMEADGAEQETERRPVDLPEGMDQSEFLGELREMREGLREALMQIVAEADALLGRHRG